ncbi:MAG: repair protein SbcC/Rad50 [Abditibacteriota bacterium]|nr:repair protein SbcC/Rad50 [Abditibacteriota bacterium]
MIPLRVHVEGFMSYRDSAELMFDGAPLWMLSGPNGAGKSTIFDAITYALYGLHRGGKQDARELINHASESLVVEFDFSVGNQAFRVRRTLSRRGRASFQALQLPVAGQSTSPRAVSETDSKAGLDRWIENVIGLDETTFTASVLLQQGKSDALLEANPAKRHEMLSQIVDLAAYEELHQKSDSRRKEFETQARLLDSQLQGIEPVEDEEIERLGKEAEAARAEAATCQQTLQELAALQVHAQRFGALQSERDEIERALAHTKVLFDQAELIERDATRWKQLQQVLPALQRIVGLREQLAQSRERVQTLEADATHAAQALSAAQGAAKTARAEGEALAGERDNWQKKSDAAHATVAQLSQPILEIEELERLRVMLAKVDHALEQFPRDLDAQIEALTQEATLLNEAKVALPWLTQFAEVRIEWIAQRDAVRGCKNRSEVLVAALEAARHQQVQLQAQLEQTTQALQSAQEEATRARTLLAEAKNRLAQFETVEGMPDCSLCGQPLTDDHLSRERARLNGEIERLQSTSMAARTQLQQAQSAQEALAREAHLCGEELHRLEREQQTQEAELRAAKAAGKAAQNQGEAAIKALPEAFRACILEEIPEKFAAYFATEYPTKVDLEDVQAQADAFIETAAQLEQLRATQSQRANYLSRREQPAARLEELEALYSPARIAEIQAAHSGAKSILENATPQLDALNARLAEMDAQRNTLEAQIEAARTGQMTAQTRLAQEGTRREGVQSTLSELEANVPAEWQTPAQSMDVHTLQQLEAERDALADAPRQQEELESARAGHHTRLTRQKQIAVELVQVPEAARRAPNEIEAEANTTRAQQSHWTLLAGEAETEKSSLQERRARRVQIDADYHTAEKQARLHKTLAELLGRDRLQRYLLQQAEASIVSNANHVLDRISGGTLRLELRRNEEEGEENRDTKAKIPKALDLIAYNMQTGGNALPVYLLSGSQRFRVAVSLALGIGQFAGHGQSGQTLGAEGTSSSSRRIESVIIDEGFGSLDQEGRREIIDELHNLKNVLHRIILVSHQEEFADAFPNRYLIELKDGTSSARIVQDG